MVDHREFEKLGSWSGWAGERAAWPVSLSGEAAIDWAIGMHSAQYGDDLLSRALLDQGPHPFVQTGRWPLTSVHAVVSLLARACALAVVPKEVREGLAPQPGMAPNRGVISDLEVLEIAGFAIRDGWRVDVEAELPSGRRPDLRLVRGDQELWIEVSRVGPDQERQCVESWMDEVVPALLSLESKWGVRIGGRANSTALTGSDLESFLGCVDAEAERVATSGRTSHLREAGVTIDISPACSEPLRFDGPPLDGDMWTRLGRRLHDKARQTQGSAAAWIYLQDWSGLFQLTDLALDDEPEQLRRLTENITAALAAYPHVTGVLFSTGTRTDSQEVDHDTLLDPHSRLNAGSRVLRRRLPGGRCRRTFVVRLANNASSAAKAPQRWFEDEGSWLAWALDAAGQPALERILEDRL